MPTYEYECSKCRKTFEMFQSMNDPALITCPKEHCRQRSWGKGKVQRLLGTGAGLIFKGSGFYITDYRSEGYRAAAKTESGAGGGEAKASEAKTGSTDTKASGTEGGSASDAKKPDAKPTGGKQPKTPKNAD